MADHWNRIADKLPDLDIPVWLWGPNDGIWIGARTDDGDGYLWGLSYGSQYRDNDGWKSEDLETDDYRPTHWMPLPNIPGA